MLATAPATLLVIDDEPDNYDVAVTQLQDEPYLVLYANSAARARAILSTTQVELILLDVMMPGTDGIELCREFRADPHTEQIPIIMVTALSDKAALARALDAGADDFISKPVAGIELRARVRAHLRSQARMAHTHSLLRHQERALTQLRKMLTTTLSHELRTPLNGIVGPLDLLRSEGVDFTTAEIREMLGLIEDSSRRMESLIERLLIFLQLEAQQLDANPRFEAFFEPRGTEISPVLVAVAERVAASAGRSDDLVLQTDALAIATLGEEPLGWILRELIDNACKFSEPGTLIEVSVTEIDGISRVLVRDHGHGLSPKDAACAGAFIQFDRSQFEQQGIGLGLAIVRGVVAMVPEARLELLTPFGRGTSWQVSLPQPVDEDDAPAMPEEASADCADGALSRA